MSRAPFDSADACQLQRDIVSVVLHELGNITSALALRVDGTPRALTASDTAAIHTLTMQLRTTTQPLAWLRGAGSVGVLAPSKHIAAHAWWAHMATVAASVLPRGSRCTASDADAASLGAFTPDHAWALTMLTLAACHHFIEAGFNTPVCIVVRLPRGDEPGAPLALSVSDPHTDFADVMNSASRWRAFSERAARRAHVELGWWTASPAAHSWHWHCTGQR